MKIPCEDCICAPMCLNRGQLEKGMIAVWRIAIKCTLLKEYLYESQNRETFRRFVKKHKPNVNVWF